MNHSLSWLVPSLCGVFLSCLPAEAAQLKSWRFDQDQNRLEFSTDEEILPKVQLIPDPTRLVVDLPGIVLDQKTLKRSLSSQFRSVRLGQVDAQTARIVLELDPAYTLDPQQVKVKGSSPTNWSINLPTPQRWQASDTPSPRISTAKPLTPQSSEPLSQPKLEASKSKPEPVAAPPVEVAQSPSDIRDILVTVDGLFLPTKNSKPKIKVKRSRNKKEIQFKISGTTIAPQLAKTFSPGYHGIESMTFKSVSSSEAELIMQVDRDSPDWYASVSRFSGIVLLPKGGPSANRSARRPGTTVSLGSPNRVTSSQASSTSQIATIQRIDLGGRQLLIRADQPIRYTTRWSGRDYQLTIESAQLADDLKAPKLGSSSPVSDVKVEQSERDTVTISIKPSTNVRVTGVQKLNNQSVAINLLRPGQRPIARIPSTPIAPRSPLRPGGNGPRPAVRGKRVIVIDPGHGGPDPGAIGIGGVRETNVVLDISLEVSRILQRQGVTVYLTRTDERDVDLPPRVSLAERVRATAFVSIHANAISMSRPDVNGLETYHAPGARLGSRFARTVHNTILRSLRMRDRKVRPARFYVIRKTSMPAILVETGFLTGREDIVNLRSPAWRKRMAQAIAQGILNYLDGRYN